MSEPCVRKRIVVGGENYYLIMGKNFVQATVPYENRPDRLQERAIVEAICEAITEMMEEKRDQSNN